ncbi:hypothetical protein PoB_006884600 [Plakobranchus ocellatus]|uniref:Uncharacterized protein n=1 Tax=Plakobranchus ocellatus TaxID=259542 RepID=A0AAV4DDW6_9GAST|nr:hypothetical protein PoB_006884600 [Plakobranchus ocellatus]
MVYDHVLQRFHSTVQAAVKQNIIASKILEEMTPQTNSRNLKPKAALKKTAIERKSCLNCPGGLKYSAVCQASQINACKDHTLSVMKCLNCVPSN